MFGERLESLNLAMDKELSWRVGWAVQRIGMGHLENWEKLSVKVVRE